MLSASLICGDPLALRNDLKEIEKGEMDMIHFDVMDGNFVPRFGFYPEILKAVKNESSLPVDVHLMIDEPVRFISAFAEAGADIIVVHAEATNNLHYAVRTIKEYGIEAGVSLNPATPLSVLDYVLDDITNVTLMAINPGIVGHKLIPGMMDKIAHLKTKIKNHPDIKIEIDGGVTPESATKMIQKGADILVCGTSSVFKPDRPLSESARAFRQLIDSELESVK